MMTVLITGCSMHSNDLINVLRDNYDNEEIKIVGTNCDDAALLRKGVDAGYVVPRSDTEEYLPKLIEICNKEGVDVILPFITMELPIMAVNREYIESQTHAKVSVSSLESLELAGDKISLSKMYPELMPKQKVIKKRSDIEDFCKEVGYPDKPICCKLPNRCGGLGFAIIDEEKGLDLSIFNKFGIARYITLDMFYMLYDACEDDIILQEYESGIDYSMCGLAENGKMLYGLGFEAPIMSYGSAMVADIKQVDAAYEIAKKVVEDTGLDGNFCLDFMLKPDGSVKMLEVNPRVSATLPFIAKAGLNLPYLRCRQLLGFDVASQKFDINYGLRMSKNYESEYF